MSTIHRTIGQNVSKFDTSQQSLAFGYMISGSDILLCFSRPSLRDDALPLFGWGFASYLGLLCCCLQYLCHSFCHHCVHSGTFSVRRDQLLRLSQGPPTNMILMRSWQYRCRTHNECWPKGQGWCTCPLAALADGMKWNETNTSTMTQDRNRVIVRCSVGVPKRLAKWITGQARQAAFLSPSLPFLIVLPWVYTESLSLLYVIWWSILLIIYVIPWIMYSQDPATTGNVMWHGFKSANNIKHILLFTHLSISITLL